MSDIFSGYRPRTLVICPSRLAASHIETQEELSPDSTYEICIDFNDKEEKQESLLKNAKSLCKKYPKLKESS